MVGKNYFFSTYDIEYPPKCTKIRIRYVVACCCRRCMYDVNLYQVLPWWYFILIIVLCFGDSRYSSEDQYYTQTCMPRAASAYWHGYCPVGWEKKKCYTKMGVRWRLQQVPLHKRTPQKTNQRVRTTTVMLIQAIIYKPYLACEVTTDPWLFRNSTSNPNLETPLARELTTDHIHTERER